ncbi:MAG TPA: hypothetical protein VD694_03680 [Nitrososphaeraceae archaeon]|nr:hypothetical protein [Nitrososphaeraceae archaeon]
MSLFLNGSILSPYSTFIYFVLADSEDSKDNKDKEVSDNSNEEEKSFEKNSDNEDNTSSEKSDEQVPPSQDNPPNQDDLKEEEPSTNEEQNPPKEEEPPEEEPPEEEPPQQEASPPIIITNTVTAPAVSSPSDDEDDDENEGPTKFAFIDSFFTDQIAQGSVIAATSSDSSATQDIPPVTKQEVGPGEGDSILAIVLINRGFSDVTSIRATLDFPSGFSSNITPKNIDNDTSLASYNGLVEAGQTFTLYFPVNISKDTQVGKEYTASLNIDYFNIAEKDEENMRDRTLKIPFMLSGKVILDTISFSSSESSTSFNQTFPDTNSMVPNVVNLVPGAANIVQTLIKNEGSAAATGVIVEVSSRNQQDRFDNDNLIPTSSNTGNSSSTTVQQSTVIPLISAGTTTFNVGIIPAGESIQINPVIFASNSVGSILENIDLRISYNNAYGYKKTLDKSMGVHILPSSPQSGLTLSSSVTTAKTTSSMPPLSEKINQNSGEYGLVSADNYGTNRQNLTYPISQISEFTSGDSSLMPNDVQSNNTSNIGIGLDATSNKNTVSLIAGRVDELKFNISNTNENPIIDAVVSLDSESSSIKILGDSKWNLNKIDPLATEQFQTRVFASKSLINSPVSFKVSIQYLDNNEAKSDSFNLGANVIGDITVNINDLAINYIGGNPNLVGNILNKGNTLALFTTIEILSSSSSPANQSKGKLPSSTQTLEKKTILVPASSFPQYLGDLEENSPLPFSIPLAMNNNTASGIYPVSLKVTYSDDLRNSFTVINNGTVEFISPITTTNKGQGFLGNYDSLLVALILAIGGIFGIFIIRRLRSKKKADNKNYESGHDDSDTGNDDENIAGNTDDIESILGEEGSNFKENFQKK